EDPAGGCHRRPESRWAYSRGQGTAGRAHLGDSEAIAYSPRMSALPWSGDVDLSSIPEQPGVYLFQDERGKVLYVGKAADLRARLRSYRRMAEDGRGLIRFMEKDAR